MPSSYASHSGKGRRLREKLKWEPRALQRWPSSTRLLLLTRGGRLGPGSHICCKVHAAQRACFRHCQAHFTAPAAPAGRAGRSVQHRGRFGVMQTPLTTGTRSCQPGAATSAAVQPARNLPLVGMSLNNCPGENITLLTKISQLAILALAGPQSQ